jgi:putative lipase involved disintegration of autophagic bodies
VTNFIRQDPTTAFASLSPIYNMLKAWTAIVFLTLGTLASILPGDQLSFKGNAVSVHSMTLQHQYVDNPDKAYSMNRVDITAAASTPIELKSYYGMYTVPSRAYVSSLKEARTPRSMFTVFDRPEGDWRPHIGHLPNVRSRETVLALAQMANNAYSADEKSSDWRDVDDHWHVVRFSRHLIWHCCDDSDLFFIRPEWLLWL